MTTNGRALLSPVYRALDATGTPMPGALLQFYLTGTTTPSPAYTDDTLVTPLSNPVVADGFGLFAPMFLDPTIAYRAQLKTSGGTLIQDVDPVFAPWVPAAGSITGAMLVSGAIVASLGFTPLNRAGDTATNLLIANSALSLTSAGYLGAPVNEQDASYTLVLGDAGKVIRTNSASALAYTIPLNATVAFPLGTVIGFRNIGAGVLTITRTAGVTLTIAGGGTSQDVAMAQYGLATMVRETADTWVISGTGLS